MSGNYKFKIGDAVCIIGDPADYHVARCLGETGVIAKFQSSGAEAELLMNRPHHHWRDKLYVNVRNLAPLTTNGWKD